MALMYGKYGKFFLFNQKGGPTVSEGDRKFRKAQNTTKISVNFNVEDIDKSAAEIEALKQKQLFTKIIYENRGKFDYVVLAEVPEASLSTTITSIQGIKSINNLKSVNTESQPPLQNEANIQERLKINRALKEKYLKDINRDDMRYSYSRIQEALDRVQSSIDSLTSMSDKMQYLKNSNLVYLKITQNENRPLGILTQTAGFFYRFIVAVVIMIIFLLIGYFVLYLFMKVMRVMGIRTAKGSKGGGKYGYGGYKGNYTYGSKSKNKGGSYTYGGSNRKRIVKRVYKDGAVPPENSSTDDNSNKDK